MAKLRALGVLMTASMLLVAGDARADNPHLVRYDLSCDGSDLVVGFKVAGLGDETFYEVSVEVDDSSEGYCINNGENVPQGHITNTEASDEFPASKNGSLTGELDLDSGLECKPKNWTEAVHYEDIYLYFEGQFLANLGDFDCP